MHLYICPVCAYTLSYPPEDFNICPCCGTEFGYDDTTFTYRELRNKWLATGAKWFSPVDNPPFGWNPFVQLILADYEFDVPLPENALVGTTQQRIRVEGAYLMPVAC